MSISFTCECGRSYSVNEELVGKKLRCKQCGRTTRLTRNPSSVPDPEPLIDAYGLDEISPPAPAPRETEAVLPGRSASRTVEKTSSGKSKKSKAARLLEAIPGKDDLIFPIIGVVSLVVTGIFVVIGGFLAVAWMVFVALAAPVIGLWAGISALKAAHERDTNAFWPLVGAFVSSFSCYILFLAKGPTNFLTISTAAAAVGGFARFISAEKRFHSYSRPVALGVFSLLLMASLTLMVAVVRQRMAEMGLTNDPIPQASTLPPPQLPSTDSATGKSAPAPAAFPLVEARKGFKTALTRRDNPNRPVTDPPSGVFTKVKFNSPVGPLAAYLTPPPATAVKLPAIIWITGGDCNTIDDVWSDADPNNDQTASAYRKAGIVMMFPSLRGGNDNPGVKESFLGEVDDILAAADFLAKREYVDPSRIYLGGHSTGGTLVMLVAACTDRFRAVFSFGPVHNVAGYGDEFLPFDASNQKEVMLRSPGAWLNAVRCPTYVLEGTRDGNILSLAAMERSTSNPMLHFYKVKNATHFSILAPTNQTIASKILKDEGPSLNLPFSEQELSRPFGG